MDDATKVELDAIGSECVGLMDEIDQAFDEHAEFSYKLSTRIKVDDCAQRYRTLVAGLDEAGRMSAERIVGRRIREMQVSATKLPAPPAGARAEKAPQKDFWEARPLSAVSSRQPRVMGAEGARVERPQYRVTGDVEAYCGPCGEVKTHTINAIVAGLPAQVTCQRCNGKHKYRAEAPDRAKKGAATSSGTVAARLTPAEVEHQRKAQEKRSLIAELGAATAVRTFTAGERYRAGEIIDHPEHGRGKIESVLPRSMLVRFGVGLRPVKLS